ncbi:MAG: hypothetical protein EPN41_14165 [Candidimonas sp.]|nr:MAG: hypothetical protein EPN41_14165 [Candidimonas sp.]
MCAAKLAPVRVAEKVCGLPQKALGRLSQMTLAPHCSIFEIHGRRRFAATKRLARQDALNAVAECHALAVIVDQHIQYS